MKLGTAHVNIKANLRPLRDGLRSARKLVLGAMRKISRIITRVAKIGALAFTAVSLAAIKMAMDVEESENLFVVSMGKMEEATRKWSNNISEALGLNRFEVRKFVSIFNVMLESMGIAPEVTADMSKNLTKLALDMASFFNLKPAEAFQKLQAGISGEIEPLKRLGILVNETTIKTFALNKGLIKEGEVLSETQKVMVRFMVINEQTAKAHGDLERTLNSSTNVLRTIKSLVAELTVEYGNRWLPTVNKVLVSMRDWLKENKAVVTDWADRVVASVLTVVRVFRMWFDMIRSGEAAEAFRQMATLIINIMKKIWEMLRDTALPAGKEIGKALAQGIASALKEALADTKLGAFGKLLRGDEGFSGRAAALGSPVAGLLLIQEKRKELALLEQIRDGGRRNKGDI